MAKLYVLRRSGSKLSNPMTVDEVKQKITNGEIAKDDKLSLHPNDFSSPVSEYPEFEAELNDPERTQFFKRPNTSQDLHEDKTRIFSEATKPKVEVEVPIVIPVFPVDDFSDPVNQNQITRIIERPKELFSKEEEKYEPKSKSKFGFKVPKKSFLVMILLVIMAYEMLFEDDIDNSSERAEVVMVPVRPQLPAGGSGRVDPELSVKIYGTGIKFYVEDTVQGYRRAADIFQASLKQDPQNVKALAMLASSYLNLIDSSNKDENTFSVINKLIELSRLKQLDLVETLIAEVEFMSTSRRYDAGIQRLVDFSKVSGKFDPVLYYYLALLYTNKGEYGNASKYLSFIANGSLPIPRLFYLRGYLHEENKEFDEAIAEYRRALAINPNHTRSKLGIVRVAEKRGELKQVVRYVESLVNSPSFQSPSEYVQALIYRSKLSLIYQRPDEAIKMIEKALRIDPKNEELQLERYSLLSASAKDSKYKNLARMYALILEGNRNFKAGKIHEAISVLLQAQDTFSKSTVPYEKMGDLFYQIGQYERAQENFKKALEIDKTVAGIAIKLIDALIHNHEWEEAQKFLAKYRNHPQVKSSVDRLAGDLAFKQANYSQAITFYRKAMARDSIDTEVYSAYANALSEVEQCKDAQFFYSIALRLDPYSHDAILGSAKCLLKSEGISSAVSSIQDNLTKLPKARADLLVGIAEIYLLSGDTAKALQFTGQARELDPDYADAYRIEGNIFEREIFTKKEFKKKALESYKNYSDRKVSDPYGYLQRFAIFLKDSNFDAATEELEKVFEISPRYPELHFRRAQMYSKMGRTKEALAELEQELKINGRLVKALVEQGNILVRLNNLDEAGKSYTTAMSIDPLSAPAKVGAGYTSYLKRQFPSAIALLQSAIQLDRGNPEIYKKLGQAYRDSGDSLKAAQAFQNYLDLAPDAPDRAEYEQYKQ